MLHVRDIDEVGKPAAFVDHCQVHTIGSDPERDLHSATTRDSLVGFDCVRHRFGRHPPEVIEPVTVEHLGRSCRSSDDHSDHRDQIGASGDVDVDDMKRPAGRGVHQRDKLAHGLVHVRERVASPVRAGTRLPAVDSVWEQWDLVCADPGGCDPLDQLMRAIVWALVVVAWMIFFAALRPWTTDLPKPVAIAVAALGSAVIVWFSVGIVGSSGNLRTAGIIAAVGLLAVWIGRPGFTERRRNGDEVNEAETSTSSTR